MAARHRLVIRVMTDTNVLVAGNAFPRWPYEVLQHALRGDYEFFLCPYILREARRAMRRAFPDDAQRLEKFLKSCWYHEIPDPFPRSVLANLHPVRSGKDVPVALAARKARAHYLVTHDKDLTVEDSSTERTRQWFTPILPALFLRDVMGWSSEELEEIRYRTWEDLVSG